MADLIYNPLLKKGFQEVSDTGSIEAEIDDLRQHKVTKFFAAADNLENGEIAQYQGEDDLVNNLKKGYFYQKTGSTQELPAGTQFFNNIATTVNLYGYNVKPGNFYVKENKTPTTGSNFFNYNLYRFENFWNYQFLTLNDARPDVGDILFNTNNNTIVTVLQVTFDAQFRTNYILSDGTTIVLTARTGHALNALYTFIDNDLNIYTIADCRELNSWVFLHYSISDNTFNIIDWFTIPYELLQTTSQPVIIGNNVFQQSDTQPKTPGITEENGTLKVSLPVEFADDVTVKGTQTVVHTQEIESENDFITLRADNPLPLGNNEKSGIYVNNYDGNGTDCVLAVDKQGWARVGDSSGTLQKLATIEETPTDGQFIQYDAQNKQLKTAAIPEATAAAAGLMSAENYNKINLSYKNGDGSQNMTAAFFLDIAADVLNKGFNQKTVIATIITNGSYCSGLITVFRFNNNIYGSILLIGYNFFRVALISNSVVSIYEINKTLV